MGEFFRGWRRKIGCLTLVMALVAMAGWVRSLGRQDSLSIRQGKQVIHIVSSSPFGIEWQRKEELLDGITVSPLWKKSLWFWTNPWDNHASSFNFFSDGTIRLRWELFGFCIGQKIHDDSTQMPDAWVRANPESKTEWRIYRIPYWSITVPLTVISAFLFLSKPRKSTQMKITEPISVEGA